MKKTLLVFTLTCGLWTMDCGLLHAQPPPPPPPQGIGAPIDNDAALLLIIVAVYGTIKIYNKKHTSIKPIL